MFSVISLRNVGPNVVVCIVKPIENTAHHREKLRVLLPRFLNGEEIVSDETEICNGQVCAKGIYFADLPASTAPSCGEGKERYMK